VKKPTPFGKYYLLERINVGGMAEVFRAKAFGVEGFERLVAVKRILPNIAEDKEFIRMFIEEAKLAVQLNHANIAQIFDLGVVDGSYYIALEHVHGRDLRAMFDRCRQIGDAMPVSQACFCVMKVCEGLDYAHNKRDQGGRDLHLVHRDVSPQNVLVSFEGEVKLIDFGIAKAAGKGSKTQAGILKGKFGYMSPEQVRGIPVDRRSDVFSCGIVLYELLTGERLFVGESDFSTLEKVRNVEILPPSTYNRRIPDELERIVLKALTKDPDERYQNAIDLHDELQAFVYTAGEFYSRKDLAGWMKKTFGREIEEETAKLESYRQLKAPAGSELEARPAVSARMPSGTRPPTVAGTPVARKSHPSGGHPKPPTAPPPPPPTPTTPVNRASTDPPTAARPAATSRKGLGLNAEALAWDDDELETQIYDSPDDGKDTGERTGERAQRMRPRQTGGGPALPLASPPVTPQPPPAIVAAPPVAAPPIAAPPPIAPPPTTAPPPFATKQGVGPGPDLSSLVSTGKAWGEPKPPTHPPPMSRTNGSTVPPPQIAVGSGKGPAPMAPFAEEPLSTLAGGYGAASSPQFAPHDPVFDGPSASYGAGASFGQGMLARKSSSQNTKLFIAIGGAAVAVVAVVIIIASTGGGKTKPGNAAKGSAAASAAPTVAGDSNTGFDLYVTPAGTMTWRLDGEARTDRLPSRIRGISPGKHMVAIDAPAGFMSQNMPIEVELGKAPKVEIVLQALDISGVFESDPPGASVSLIVDGKREPVGTSPAKSKLDPRKTYQVLFEKPGFVSINRPIVFTGALEQNVSVDLEKVGGGGAAASLESKILADAKAAADKTEKTEKKKVVKTEKTEKVEKTEPKVEKTEPKVEKTEKTEPKVEKTEPPAEPKGTGTLLLGSKPPCEIFIDGKSTGLSTPQKDIKLPSGKHKVTLINNEYGIKESFSVEIKADVVEKAIKDYSDKLPK
jgi:eukaryotic-like serine/threonine-protein kinase